MKFAGLPLGLSGAMFCVAALLLAASPVAVSANVAALAEANGAGVVVVGDIVEGGGARDIGGAWRFHAGDDASWAAVDVDDRGWSPVQVPLGIGQQGLSASDEGMFWYRVRLHLDASRGLALALHFGDIDSAYEVFADGVRIGGLGSVDVPRVVEHDKNAVWSLPSQAVADGVVVVAVRVWQAPFRKDANPSRGGIDRAPMTIGAATDLAQEHVLVDIDELCLALVFLTTGIHHLQLHRRRREQREYRWFGLLALAMALYISLHTNLWKDLGLVDCMLRSKIWLASLIAVLVFVSEFLWPYLGKAHCRVRRAFQVVSVAYAVAVCAWPTTWLLYKTLPLYEVVGVLPLLLCAVVFICQKAFQQNPDARTIFFGIVALVVSALNNVGRERMLWDTPEVSNWAMGILVVSMAVSLSNRFSRVYGTVDEKNAALTSWNAASKKFIPLEFLALLDKKSIVDVERGDHVQQGMSVLFTDIRSFTTIVEQRTPEENFAWINRYLLDMEPAIVDNGGFIDSFIGDAIMALFAGPADDAVKAGIALHKLLEEHNAKRAKDGDEPLHIGVGVSTGDLMLGTIGGARQMKCGVIGDCVNLASRVEGMTKRYDARFLITDDTKEQLASPSSFTLREVDRVRVKGKRLPATVYEVIDADDDATALKKTLALSDWNKALARYRAGEFAEAAAAFDALADHDEADGLYAAYAERARAWAAAPPPAGWDGVETLQSK